MDFKGKRLVILGAGRGQVGLYKAAQEMGIYTIAGTLPGKNLPGVALCNEVCYMDVSKPDEVLKKVSDLDIDGIATCCMDTGIVSVGKVCDFLSLTGLTESAAIMCGDKLRMKRAFIKYGVQTARFLEVHNEADLMSALESLGLPVIIKATDLQGSNGIYIAKTVTEAISGFHEAMSKTKRDYCIVEQYIEGYEFGAQAFVYKGDILFVMPHGDETYMSHTAVPIGHYVPFEANIDIHNQAKEAVTKAIKALGLDNCAVNVDLIIKNNTVYVIELTGRAGANCLPELTQINYGIEYYKMIAAMALGGNPKIFWDRRRSYTKAGLARMILETDRTGIFRSFNFLSEIDDKIDYMIFKNPGDTIRVFENSNDCIGQVITVGDSIEECRDNINKFTKSIDIKVV